MINPDNAPRLRAREARPAEIPVEVASMAPGCRPACRSRRPSGSCRKWRGKCVAERDNTLPATLSSRQAVGPVAPVPRLLLRSSKLAFNSPVNPQPAVRFEAVLERIAVAAESVVYMLRMAEQRRRQFPRNERNSGTIVRVTESEIAT